MTEQNYYEFLGIPRDASAEVIGKAFREKALVLHPDRNRHDPEGASKFQLLTKAYQTLNDPVRRKKYDAGLPPLPGEKPRITEIHQLWQAAGKLFFERTHRFTPSMDAMRVSVPITLEDEALLVVGLDPAHANLLSYLTAMDVKKQIAAILSELYGRPLDFRPISGTTLHEWQGIKAGEEAVARKRTAAAREPKELNGENGAAARNGGAEMPSGDGWEALQERLLRDWSLTDARTYPQTRARFALEHFAQILQAEEAARSGGMADEAVQRQLARILDRLGGMTGMESGIIALEYLRYCARVRGGML